MLPQGKRGGAGRVRVKAGARPLARWAFRLHLPQGQRGSVGRQHMAWLWQGRGRQEQAPSGLETQAQHSYPPTCPRCAQDPTVAGRLKLSVGAVEGSRVEEKVGCWALATPSSVLRSNAGPWIPWPLPAAGGSRGKEALNYWERGERNPVQHTWG